uniref:Movement protein TGB2 n=1 Tax=Coleus vein necrosis virus TaxID=404404 RepID=Q06B62_9VIRU|nr:TGB2 protein [Coleus vein necrosis virus]
MPLKPPDNTKSILAIATGAGLALVLYTLTRSTLPQVGDNIHSLPHGGFYKDGTKTISYCSPSKTFPGSILAVPGSLWPFVAVVVLTCLILLTNRKEMRCPRCLQTHS